MADDQAGTSSIPSLVTQPVASAAGGVATASDIGALLGPVAQRANAALPDPYTQGVQVAEPHQRQIIPMTQRDDHRTPITGNAGDIRRARRQNAVAGLSNTIQGFTQRLAERKQADLKDKLVDVMKAKGNIANATAVLKQEGISDTQKQQAQNVLQANTKQLNNILSEPKNAKALAKALDISYVDPEKNKTPEVKAFQQAHQEYEKSGEFKSDNPMEHSVAQAAQQAGKVSNSVPTAQPQIVEQKSATPYADRALAKDMPTMQANPQYAAAVQQKQVAEKQMAVIIPKLIDAEAKAQLQAAKDTNSVQRQELKASSDLYRQMVGNIDKAKLQQGKDKAAMARVAARNANELATTTMRVNASLKIADDNRLSKDQAIKIKGDSLAELTKTINTAEETLKTAENNLKALKDDKASPAAIEAAEIQRDIAISGVSGLTTLRANKFGGYNPDQKQGALLNGDSGSEPSKDVKIQPVGSADSDSDEDESDY